MTFKHRHRPKTDKLISFNTQLNRIFVIIILVPVLLLSSLSIYYSFSKMKSQREAEIQNLIFQSQQAINDIFITCENNLRYLTANSTLIHFLLTNSQDYFQISKNAKTMRMLFYNTLTTNPYCEDIVLYNDTYQYALSNFVETPPIMDEWYQKTLSADYAYWFQENGSVYIARKLVSAYQNEPLGVLRLKLKNSVFTDNIQIFESFPALITISHENTTILKHSTSSWKSRNFIHERFDLASTNWKLHYKIVAPYHVFSNPSSYIPFFLLLIVLLLSRIITHFFLKRITTDLTLLVEDVKKAQEGNLNIKLHTSKIQEINFLSINIQTFLTRIEKLIHQVYRKEIQRQDLELSVLRSKINPHFLYNNLSTINWLALSCGQEQIAEIATELVEFYRTALNKGKDIDCLAVEIKNIKAYLNLQLIAHSHSFDVIYDCPPEYLNIEIPLFILQPLVENAIEHGIDLLSDFRGRIEIHLSVHKDRLSIRICDNGLELYKKIGTASLTPQSFGYGTKNVQRRIQLLYGSDSGLTISASKEGTVSELCFHYLHLRHIHKIQKYDNSTM